VHGERLCQLAADGERRVERTGGALGDVGDALAPDGAEPGRREREEVEITVMPSLSGTR